MIPKIIHQTAPSDTSKWHPLWVPCQKSWQTQFSDFEYKLWNDSDIDNLVKEEYSQYYHAIYKDLPAHIMKIDFARFVILHKFGGIYADMDMFCYKNFYDDFGDPACYVVENPLGNDPIENSLMASVPNHSFWIHCINLSIERFVDAKIKNYSTLSFMSNFSTTNNKTLVSRPALVFHITGTQLVSSVYRKYGHIVGTFPGHLYNNSSISYDPEFRTKHLHTGLWGQEDISQRDEHKNLYDDLKNISIKEFDFYKDYSNNHYLKTNSLDIYKNAYEYDLTSNITYR